MFTSGHIGEEIEFLIALHNGKTGESFAREAKVLFARKNDIARRIINTSDHRVGLTGLDHGAGSGEVGGVESGDF